MQQNQMVCAYFSPCGTTKKAVCTIGEVWQMPTTQWDMTPLSAECTTLKLAQDDLLILGVPSFGGRVPEIAMQRIQQLQGNHTPAIAVVTYGNRAFDDTFAELQDGLQAQGFCVVAGIAAVTQHSIMPQFGNGRPNAADLKELQSFANQIKENMQTKEWKEISLPGNRPYLERHGGGLVPVTDITLCKGCGLCATHCPTGAIPKDAPQNTDAKKCVSCMGCISVCPSHARSLPAPMVVALTARLEKVCSERKENQLFL